MNSYFIWCVRFSNIFDTRLGVDPCYDIGMNSSDTITLGGFLVEEFHQPEKKLGSKTVTPTYRVDGSVHALNTSKGRMGALRPYQSAISGDAVTRDAEYAPEQHFVEETYSGSAKTNSDIIDAVTHPPTLKDNSASAHLPTLKLAECLA